MKTYKVSYVSCLLAMGAAFPTMSFAAPLPSVSVGVETTQAQQAGFAYDDATVKPMPLPMATTAPSASKTVAAITGTPGSSAGAKGSGVMSPVSLGAAAWSTISPSAAITPQEYGTSNHVFTTSRVDLAGATPANAVSSLYPYRAAGKLYFKVGTTPYVCSASLIKKGIIVTAAHCVSEFGGALPRWHTNFQFVPAKYGNVAPYGVWNATSPRVMTAYYNGTDSCSQAGVVCRNDVAVLTVTPKAGVYPGASTGWFGYGWNGQGFTATTPKKALINQLGYPVSHDGGLMMQRTDSDGFVDALKAGNTIWGSRQTGGSSGGPELVNLGNLSVALTGGVTKGSGAGVNMVVGVTSWGYTNQAVKEMGASPFTSTNITVLVNNACTATPAACAP